MVASYVSGFAINNSQATTSSSAPVTIPSTAAAGDIAIISFSVSVSTGSFTGVPTGWNLLQPANVVTSPSSSSFFIFGKQLVAGDVGATVTFTYSDTRRIVGVLTVAREVTLTGSILATLTDNASTDTISPLPSAANIPAGSFVLASWNARNSHTTNSTITPPAPYTAGVESKSAYTTSPNITTRHAHIVVSSGGTYGGESATTQQASFGVNYLLALPPTVPPPAAVPVANFSATPLKGSNPLNVQFTDTSSETPTSWLWDFGDATSSTVQNPSKSYANAGLYTVKLTATNSAGSGTHTKTDYINVLLAGSLPGEIDGVEPEAHSRAIPMVDTNGNLYRVTEEYGNPPVADGTHNQPRMMKSSDGGTTWAEMDKANRPTDNDLESMWVFQFEQTIYGAWSDGGRVSFWSFNTSNHATLPDKWGIKNEKAIIGLTSGSQQYASLLRLSDGRFRAFFNDTLATSNHQIAFVTRATAGGWSVKTRLTVDTDDHVGPAACVDSADNAHIFYHNYSAKTILYRKITSADAVSNAVRVDTTTTHLNSRNFHAVSNPIAYVSGTSTVVSALYAAATGLRLVSVINDVVQSEQLVDFNDVLISPANSEGTNTGNDGPSCHLAVDGTTLYAIWTESSTGDVYWSKRPHGGAWSTRALLWDAPLGRAGHWVYSNVYTRGAKKVLGYTYDDGPHIDNDSNIWYNEMAIVQESTNLNKVKLGINNVALRHGATLATRAYVGTIQVWP